MKNFLGLLVLVGSIACGQAPVVFDTLELRGFVDGVMKTKMRDKPVAGAVVAVVHQGKLIFAKGYGWGDVKNQIPVFPDSTLFRIGSISKLFVWISVMQLVQQGKLDLDADVNRYLTDFKIPNTYPEPITLKNLLTHTAGFEDIVINLFAKDPSKLLPLAEILKKELPGRVRPPGTHASYSNHGTGLAALLVERASGLNFHDYVEKNILANLVMNRTTFRQPVPASLAATASRGYVWQDGVFQQKEFEFVPLYPVGAASATGTDMANLMIALLDQGKKAPYRLLDSAVWKKMQEPLHRHHPRVNPMRYGLMDFSQNGETIIGHGGDTFWFHSLLAVFPERQLGLFVSFNTDKGGGAYSEVLEEFVDHYFPDRDLSPALQVSRSYLQQFSGTYLGNRYPHRDLTKMAALFTQAKISAVDSTRLRLQMGDAVDYFVPVDSLVFREATSSDIIVFEKKNGRVTALFLGGLPIFVFDKVAGWAAPDTQVLVLGLVLLVALLTLLFWPITYFIRRGYQPLLRTRQSLPFLAKLFAWLNFLWWILFVVGMSFILSDPTSVVFGVSAALKVVLALPLVMIANTLLLVYVCVRLVPDARYRAWSRVYYVGITLVSMLALAQLYYWNLVGYHY
jgi:CubicO group peptidase (beta-lactamase class C family)